MGLSGVDATALVGVAGVAATLAAALGGTELQGRRARQAWARQKRLSLYDELIQEAQRRRRWAAFVLLHDPEHPHSPDHLLEKKLLPDDQLAQLTARVELLAEDDVWEAWGDYVERVEAHHTHGMGAGIDDGLRDLITAADTVLDTTREWGRRLT